MDSIRSLDVFRSIPRRLEEQTVVGTLSTVAVNVVTLCAVALGAYLVVSKIEDYAYNEVREDILFENLNVDS